MFGKTMIQSSVCVLALLLSLCPTTSWAKSSGKKVAQAAINGQDNQLQQQTSKKRRFYSLGASLTTSLGTGSFAPSESYQNHFFAQSLSMFGSVTFLKKAFASVNWGFDVEYTQPDNASGQRFFPRDVFVSTGVRNIVPGLGKILQHQFTFQLQLPTSYLARVETRLLRAELGLSLSRTFAGIVSVRYGFGFAKSFHRYTSPLFNQEGAELPSILMRQSTRSQLDVGDDLVPQPGTKNVSMRVRNGLSVTVRPLKTLSVGASFIILNAFRYATPDDEFTPNIPTENGDVKADTVGRLDFTIGDIFVHWQPLQFLGLTLGAISMQTPFAANNKGLRVPFLNLVTPNDNTTTFYLRMTGTY